MASRTDQPNQRNPKHPGGHQSKKDHMHKDTGSPAMGKPGLAMVKTGGSIYVQMPDVMKAITISIDSNSIEEQERNLKQRPKHNQLLVETYKYEDDKGEDDEDRDREKEDRQDESDNDQEDSYMPYISWETADGYLVSVIGQVGEYT